MNLANSMVFILVLLLLVRNAKSSCPGAFASSRCQRAVSNVNDALHETCAETPFAAGCTVHRACHSQEDSTASCEALNALISVCQEFTDLSSCQSLTRACGNITELLHCDEVVDLQLPTTEVAYNSIRSMCKTHWMTGCDVCEESEHSVYSVENRMDFSDDCTDPFGTLAQMCLQMDMIPCDPWKEWCGISTNQEIPELCELNQYMSRNESHNHHMSMDESHNHGMMMGESQGSTLQSTESSGCVVNSTAESCRDYVYPEASITEDLLSLCGTGRMSMPWMPGCSIWEDCKSRHAHSNYCSPFTILATLCEDMPGMSGCRRYNTLCGDDSTVEQCQKQPAIPHAPHTMKTQEDIIEACSTHTMPHCSQCPSRGANCPHTLETMSALCFTMPSMEFCAEHNRFCSSSNNFFDAFCNPGSGDYLPPMRMYFHTGQRDIILFKEWIPESTAGYVGSFFIIVLMGILLQALRAFRAVLENYWYRKIVAPAKGDCGTCVGNSPEEQCEPDCDAGDCEPICGQESSLPANSILSIGQRNLIRATFTGLIAIVEFALMLVAMTFNVGLFIAVVTGLALGMLFLGHIPERDYTQFKTPLADRTAKPPHTSLDGGCCA